MHYKLDFCLLTFEFLMKVYIGADHRGFSLKEELRPWLEEQAHEVTDVGAETYKDGDDYVDYARAVAKSVSSDTGSRGIILCGSGVGVDIAANKIDGIRSGLGFSAEQVKSARNDDDINVLALPADTVNLDQAKEMIQTFLTTPFAHIDRYERRIEKLKKIEETN